jgi:Lytic polysaccharide mono-oxygenase, cellulose-degrading
MMKAAVLLFNLLLSLSALHEILGHGIVTVPAGRGTRWRTDKTAPINYNDNESNCGGFANQWSTNGGKCGICGDPYQMAPPRNHELGGKYGQGVIVANYTSGSVMQVSVKITANHRGYFQFDLCNVDVERESDECFGRNKLLTFDGKDKYEISTASGMYYVNLQLPAGLRCSHCVLRWTYVCGNNWGFCGDGTGKLGCGPQEHFRACSDIKIVN